MDPSQDNFGSFAAGGTASQFSGVSAGAVSGGATSSGGAMVPGGAMPGNAPVVSSGTGDVILSADGDGGGGKSRRGLVIVLIVLAVLAVGAGVGYFVWMQGGGGGESEGDQGQVVEEINFQDISTLEIFDKYYSILVYGLNKSDGQDEVGEWYFERVIEYGVGSDEEQMLLDDLEKYYKALWDRLGQSENINKVYNDLFRLYFNCANREQIVSDVEDIREESGSDSAEEYIDELVKASDYEGVLLAMALDEAEYFKNPSLNGYLVQVLDLVDVTMNSFKEQTESISRKLEMGDV